MKKEAFKVFNDEALGRIFMPDGLSYEEYPAECISPFHGRAVALKIAEHQWISVKGGGWNYGGPHIYSSKKDAELIFGLYPLSSAERELEVSRKIEEVSDCFPRVLYYKRFCDFELPSKYDFLKSIKFSNGEPVTPCLLYTQLKIPYRVADLLYITGKKRSDIIKSCSAYWKISTADYTKEFTRQLAKHIAILHKNRFINDTLDYGNVTMLAEVVDYEWVTAPGIKLFDGTYGLEITEERKEKEILYGVEICLQLKAVLHEPFNLFDIYREFVEAYSEINPQFIKENERIQKMLKKEEFII